MTSPTTTTTTTTANPFPAIHDRLAALEAELAAAGADYASASSMAELAAAVTAVEEQTEAQNRMIGEQHDQIEQLVSANVAEAEAQNQMIEAQNRVIEEQSSAMEQQGARIDELAAAISSLRTAPVRPPPAAGRECEESGGCAPAVLRGSGADLRLRAGGGGTVVLEAEQCSGVDLCGLALDVEAVLGKFDPSP